MEPITTQQALASGWSPKALSGKRFTRLFRGVYIPAAARLNLPAWVAAARLVLPPDAQVTGLTALRLRDLDIGQDLPLHFVTTARGRTHHAGTQVCTRSALVGGGDTASPMNAFVEVCRRSPLLEAVQVGDRMIHQRLASIDDFTTLRNSHEGRVATAARLVRPGAESVKETHLRLLCVLAGLPEPIAQVNVLIDGRWIARVDLLFEVQRVVLEFEGRQHLNDTVQWNKDIARLDELSDGGYRVVRVTSEMLRDPVTLVSRIESDLRARGWRGAAPKFGGLWRSTFLPRHATARRAEAA